MNNGQDNQESRLLYYQHKGKRTRSKSPKDKDIKNKCKKYDETLKTTKNQEFSFGSVLPVDLCSSNDSPSNISKSYGPVLPSTFVETYLNIKDSNGKSGHIVSDPESLSTNNDKVNLKNVQDRQHGPILPSSSINEQFSQASCNLSNNSTQIGQELQRKFNDKQSLNLKEKLVGPKLPQNLDQELKTINCEPELYGPALPPHLIKSTTSDYQSNINEAYQVDSTQSKHVIRGPQLPPFFNKIIDIDAHQTSIKEIVESSEDDECYGPLPPTIISHSKAHIALEERALQIKIDKLQESGKDHVAREEWMIELPEVHSRNLGLGPRQFRANPAPDLSDRSSWTDTPKDKDKKIPDKHNKKVDLKKEAEIKEQQRYDQEQEKLIRRHKKQKKDKSLLEIHQSNLNKEKKEDGHTRRPFNRDIDLKVNHFDEAQKKAILKKAQLLDDRFSSGQSKFL